MAGGRPTPLKYHALEGWKLRPLGIKMKYEYYSCQRQ